MKRMIQPKVQRLPTTAMRSAGQTEGVAAETLLDRVLYQSLGGTGLRAATHLKALGLLQGRRTAFLHKDSDHGDRYATTLPDDTVVRFSEDELCQFGLDDPRGQLHALPALARVYERLLRGNSVALTYKRGAAQCRPIGFLQYDLNFSLLRDATTRALEKFYQPTLTRGTDLAYLQRMRLLQAQREIPLLAVYVASLCGGQGSSCVIADAYVTRHLLDRRKAKNVTHIGVLVGPNAFRRRGVAAHNYAATMRELDKVYRDGWEHTFSTGETIAYAAPPFDMLVQIDLPEWPEGEDPDAPLSDSAMDNWLRQVALSVNTLTQRAMFDRLQSLLLNVSGDEANGLALSTAQAALVNADLKAVEEYIALDKTEVALRTLTERCSPTPPAQTPAREAIAVEIRTLAERSELTAETMLGALSVDAHGNRPAVRVELGAMTVLSRSANEQEQLAQLKSHVDLALLKEPSRRWTRHARARSNDLRRKHAQILAEWLAALHLNPALQPAMWLRELIGYLDNEAAVLRRMQAETQAALKRIDEELRPLQAQIETALNPAESNTVLTRLFDLLTAALQLVGKGVGLTAKVIAAERLVNDREECAFNADLIAAAIGVLQESRAWAATELEVIVRLRVRCGEAVQQLEQRRAAVQRRMGRHPYAHIDVIQPDLAERIGASVSVDAPSKSLTHYAALDFERLKDEVGSAASERARAAVAGLDWLSAMELAADPLSNADLPVDAVQMALNHAGKDALGLNADAAPQDWLLVAIEDETNPPLAFGSAALVSNRRSDQLQVLHVQTGMGLKDAAAYQDSTEAFDRAARIRNFFVLPALATDDPSRRDFALGLACGFIIADGGLFVLRGVSLDPENEDGEAAPGLRVPLAARVDEAIEAFTQQPEWVDATRRGVERLAPDDLAARLQAWLAHNRGISRGAGDELRREMAGYIRGRLEVVAEQLKFVSMVVMADSPAPSTSPSPDVVPDRRDGHDGINGDLAKPVE